MSHFGILQEIEAHLDRGCTAYANLQHLIHLFQGYRDHLLNGAERSEYHPDGAKDVSWKAGCAMAKSDLAEKQKEATAEQQALPGVSEK